jgi:Kef-type K+ transport system membrane component KefB
MSELFFIIGAIIIVSTILAYIGRLIKQPTILAYILTGILLGPGILKIIQTKEPIIAALSDIGIAFLLFIVGLELSYKKLKELGKNALVLGISQILITMTLGYLTVLALGFKNIEAVYIAIALTFSSTIVVVKLLSEKNDVNNIYGKMAIATLLIQDFFAIFILVFLANIKIETTLTNLIGYTFLKMLIITIAIWLFARYLIPTLFRKVSKNQELLFLSSISLCFLFALITEYYQLGLEVGAFAAGLVLASTPYNNEIIAKVRSLKDFFITMFLCFFWYQYFEVVVDNSLDI